MSSFEPLPQWRRSRGFDPDPAGRAAFRADLEPAGADAPPAPARAAAASRPAEAPEDPVRRAYEQGLAAGRAERMAEQRCGASEALAAAARELLDLRDGYLAARRREVAELALAAAAAIAAVPFAADAESLAARIGLALARLEPSGPFRVRLSPGDHALATEPGESAAGRLLRGAPVELCADPELAAGEFRLEAASAEADGRFAVVLAELRQRLAEAGAGDAGGSS